MTTTAPDAHAILLFGRWSLPRSTGLFGQTWGVTIAGGVFLMVWIGAITVTQSIWVAGILLVLEAIVFVPLVVPRRGVMGWIYVMRKGSFLLSTWRKESDFSGGVFGKTPGFGLPPGIIGNVVQYEFEVAAGQRFAANHFRGKDHWSVLFEVEPRGQEGIDQDEFNRQVMAHGDLLARLGTAAGAVGFTETIETMPEYGYRLRAEVNRIHDPNAPIEALDHMKYKVFDRSGGDVRAESRVAFIFTRPPGRTSALEVCKQLALTVAPLVEAAKKMGVVITPMSAGDTATVVARAYRPEMTMVLDSMAQRGRSDAVRWDMAGPRGAKNKWDHYLHNGYRSVMWEMACPPEQSVPATNLMGLLIPRSSMPMKRVTIIYRVHKAGEAQKMVNSDFREALAEEQSKSGIASAQATIRRQNTEAARVEQAHGSGLTRFGVLVSLTVPFEQPLAEVTPELEGLADEASLKMTRCWGANDATFAGCLGVGLLLPEYATGALSVFE